MQKSHMPFPFSGMTKETNGKRVTGVTAEAHEMTEALIVPLPVRIVVLTVGEIGVRLGMTGLVMIAAH